MFLCDSALCLRVFLIKVKSGLPHTQGTQGIQGNSGNFQLEKNLRETQGILFFVYEPLLNFLIAGLFESITQKEN